MSLKIFSSDEIAEGEQLFTLEKEITDAYKQIFLIKNASKPSLYTDIGEEMRQEGFVIPQNLRERYNANALKYEKFVTNLITSIREKEILKQRLLLKPVVNLIVKKKELEERAQNDCPYTHIRLMIVHGEYLGVHEQLSQIMNLAEYDCATRDDDYHKLAVTYCSLGKIMVEETIERVLDYKMTGSTPIGADENEILTGGSIKIITLYDRLRKFSKNIKSMPANEFVGKAIFPILTGRYSPDYPRVCSYIHEELKKHISSGLGKESRVKHVTSDDNVSGFTRTVFKS
jgi:hypothetical protein